MSTIRNWSTTAGNNNDASPDGFPENMAPSGVNDSAREVMASVRAQWERAEWFDYGDTVARQSGTVLSLTGTHTATYAIGRRRRLRLRNQGGLEMYGTITDVTLTGAATQVTVRADSGSLTGTASGVALGIVAPSSDSLPGHYRAEDGAVGTPSHTLRGDPDNGLYRIGTDNVGVAIDGALAMEFDPIGAVQLPLQPAFLVTPASEQSDLTTGSETTVVWGTEVFDQNGDFSANTFTAPVTGRYLLSVHIGAKQWDLDNGLLQVRIKTSNRNYASVYDPGIMALDADNWPMILTVVADMDALDTAFIAVQPSTGAAQTDIVAANSSFSGCLLA